MVYTIETIPVMILTECLLALIYSKLYIKMKGTGNKESNLKIKTRWIKYTYHKDVVLKILYFNKDRHKSVEQNIEINTYMLNWLLTKLSRWSNRYKIVFKHKVFKKKWLLIYKENKKRNL